MTTPGKLPDENSRRSGFDWASAYARLEKTGRRIEGDGATAPDEIRRVLRRRARELAQPLPGRDDGDISEFGTLSIGERQYGIAVSNLVELIAERGMTPVPCVPPFIAGIVNHRGRIVAVLDAALVFGGHGAAEPAIGHILIVEAADVRFGIRIVGDVSLARVTSADVIAAPPTASQTEDAFIRQATRSMVLLIDLETVWRGGRFTVNDEVR
jgi:purine-binding chemotaxis protein CheW